MRRERVLQDIKMNKDMCEECGARYTKYRCSYCPYPRIYADNNTDEEIWKIIVDGETS